MGRRVIGDLEHLSTSYILDDIGGDSLAVGSQSCEPPVLKIEEGLRMMHAFHS